MATKTLVQKLAIKPGYRLLIINPPEGYREMLSDLPDGVTVFEGLEGEQDKFDFVHLFVRDVEELNEYAPKAIEAVKPDQILWISYPKRSSGVASNLSRDKGWEVVTEAGLSGVMQIAIDETWSALRFRPKKK